MPRHKAEEDAIVKGDKLDVSGVLVPMSLPKPHPGKRLPDKDKIKLAKYVCEIHQLDKYSLGNTLSIVGIKDYTTWRTWLKTVPKIAEMFKKAEDNRSIEYFRRLKAKARGALENRIEGETRIVRTRKVKVPTKDDQKNFPEFELLMEETEKEIYIPPDTQSIIFALTNKDGSNFEKNPTAPEPEESDINIPLIKWVE